MFCIADPAYDKSLQQLQSFLAGLVAEEKLEFKDGKYLLKKWNLTEPEKFQLFIIMVSLPISFFGYKWMKLKFYLLTQIS